jgi:hypothetical protein
MHRVLLETVKSDKGIGPACKLVTHHKAVSVNSEQGKIVFEDGQDASAELIIAADGIRVSLLASKKQSKLLMIISHYREHLSVLLRQSRLLHHAVIVVPSQLLNFESLASKNLLLMKPLSSGVGSVSTRLSCLHATTAR